MIKLETPLSELKGIGPKFVEHLKKLGIETIKDLLWHFPFRYEDFSQISKIADLKIGETATISGVISDIKLRRTWKKRMFIVEALIADDTGSIKAIWFNQRFLLSILKKGKLVNLAGKVIEASKGGICLSHPVYELISTQNHTDITQTNAKKIPHKSTSSLRESALKHTGRLIPIYPETKKLTSKALRFLIKPILENLEKISDPIPFEILKQHNFPEINLALRQIHFPEDLKQAKTAKKRFAFEDLFLLQLANLRQRLRLAREKAYSFKIDIEYIKKLLSQLPFELTQTQKKSLWEILKDLSKPHPMNRLLQGDVGSGKTIVAALAALLVARNEKQVAFMAPTEVLARQHYQTFKKFFLNFDKGVSLLTSSEAKIFYGDQLEIEIKKNELIKKLASGEVKIIIGTHALIQKNIRFKNLALVVIDEQHRFGVRQRAELIRSQTTNVSESAESTKTKDKIVEKELSYKLGSIFFRIQEELGRFCREKQYTDLFEKILKEEGINFQREWPIEIADRKSNFIDFIIEDKILIDLKAKPFIEKKDYYQMKRYLEAANLELGLVVNFQDRYLKPKRVLNVKKFADSDGFVVSDRLPHFLSMSATPIPRTLTLTIFGDLDLSVISELPKGRKEIITKIVAPANRDKAYAFIRSQVKKGRQVFVICPRIEPTTNDQQPTTSALNESLVASRKSLVSLETKAVKEEYDKLSQKVFPDLRVGLLHGKMKAKEKELVMKQFSAGAIDILVSTSVVEVGVDVPNATIMMIEGAERFGLAQLYQFRGRVGRGEHQSFCFLFTDSSSKTTYKRLYSLLGAKNGFELAEKDLQIRGPGEFLGESQTGMPDLAMKAIQNPELVKAAREAAKTVLRDDPDLKKYPFLLTKLESFEREIHLE